MKQLLQQYGEYNLWSNSKMAEAIKLLSHEQQHKEIISSFSSLYKTAVHVFGAETVWYNRILKGANISKIEDNFNDSMDLLGDAWLALDDQLSLFVASVTESFLYEKLDYQSMKGDSFSEELYLVLLHMFNHSTYHRGQMVTMLRQAGAEKIPNSDFIAWARMRK
jgi:uncharacterized damage-inducible protein DinB